MTWVRVTEFNKLHFHNPLAQRLSLSLSLILSPNSEKRQPQLSGTQ